MSSEPITEFRDWHRFLSNFWPCQISMDYAVYPAVEHAYQAAKTLDPDQRARLRRTRSPGAAKHLGKRVTLRPDWDDIKVEMMRQLIRQKFTSSSVLTTLLLATGDRELIEGNYWRDTFWGQCPVGTGHNHLGKILMKVRAELRGNSNAV